MSLLKVAHVTVPKRRWAAKSAWYSMMCEVSYLPTTLTVSSEEADAGERCSSDRGTWKPRRTRTAHCLQPACFRTSESAEPRTHVIGGHCRALIGRQRVALQLLVQCCSLQDLRADSLQAPRCQDVPLHRWRGAPLLTRCWQWCVSWARKPSRCLVGSPRLTTVTALSRSVLFTSPIVWIILQVGYIYRISWS